MSIDPSLVSTAPSATPDGASRQSMGYGFSLQDISRFEDAYGNASAQIAAGEAKGNDGNALKNLIDPLTSLNEKSEELKAEALSTLGENVNPGELMMLTMRAHEFMFQCELTANVANRSSDGVQQLFRQQS